MTANLKQGGPHNSSADAVFQFWRAFARYWQESVRYYGWWRLLREMSNATRDAFLELLPSRRKARFGDLDYDWEHSVNTTRSNIGVGTQFLTGVTARPYFATEPWLFEQIMEGLTLNIQQLAVSQGVVARAGLREFTFIDLGSGKGRALFIAAEYPFRKVLGVEYSTEIQQAALENIRCYSHPRQRCRDVESVVANAAEYEFPDGNLVLFLFNPFGPEIMRLMLANLQRSLEQKPRHVVILMLWPEQAQLVAEMPGMRTYRQTRRYHIYETGRAPARGGS